MDIVTSFIVPALVGIVVGILSGLLGIGGGTILVPVFRLAFGMSPVMSTATSLFTIIPTSLSGAVSHVRHRTCVPSLGVAAGLGGAVTSPFGVWLATISPGWLIMVVAALVIGAVVAYNSNLFAVENVTVSGVEHLTTEDMTAMANVPANTTLLRVDAAGIRERLLKNAWVADAEVKRVFPNTLELAVTERTIAAVVAVPTEDAKSVKRWAIASDHMWLMPIPDQDSEEGKRTSPKVYEDAAAVLSITDVPYGTSPETGAFCTDENVNNALDIVAGMTTSLADQVVLVKATDAESTKLTLDNGVEIAFGKAEDIREKERVCLEIMEQNPGSVAYINVRVVDRPTWRAL